MAQQAEYKMIAGTERDVETGIAKLNVQGAAHWQPILMTSVLTPNGARLFVLVEHKLGLPA